MKKKTALIIIIILAAMFVPYKSFERDSHYYKRSLLCTYASSTTNSGLNNIQGRGVWFGNMPFFYDVHINNAQTDIHVIRLLGSDVYYTEKDITTGKVTKRDIGLPFGEKNHFGEE